MSGNGWIKISEKSFAQRFDVAMTPFSSAKINQNWLDIYAVSGLKLDGVLYEKHFRNGAVKLCMTHVDSSVRAWEVQCKILTLNAFHKKRRGHAETWIRNPSAQNFLINKVVLSIYMQKYLLLFPFFTPNC